MLPTPVFNRDHRSYARGKRAGCQEGLLRAAQRARDEAAQAFTLHKDELAQGLRYLADQLAADAKKLDDE